MKRLSNLLGALGLFLAVWASPALAQNPTTVKLCIPTSATQCGAVTASNPLPVSGSFSATLAGFTPNGNYGTLTATASTSASTALPAGTVVAFQNTSAVDVSCVLSAGAATATTNKLVVRAGATVYYTVGANVNTACINQSGVASNVVVLAGGEGLGTAFGGASSGSGGGGAVTMASGAVASGAYSAGSIAAGAFVSGSILSGALASGAVVDITNLSTPVAANTATATKGILLGGQYDSTQKTLTNGQQAALSASPRGALYVATGAENLVVVGAGTAGSASGGVMTVQGAASMTPLFVSSSTAPVSTMNSASANSGLNSALAGVFDDTSPTAITENNFGFLRMSANRNLYGTIRDAAGNERGANVDASSRLTTAPTMVSGSVASGAFASGSIGSGAIASGAVASGAVASGAFASGALASGSVASGAVVDLGSQADAACGTATGTCSLIALTKYLNTAANSSIPAGTALIGDVNLRQGGTALSTTNGIYSNLLQGNAVLSATNPIFAKATDGTNSRIYDPCEIVAHVTTPISISSAATSVIVAGTSSKRTYICSMMLFSAGTTNVGIVQGSGTTCGTSTLGLIGGATSGTGPNLTAQAGFVAGNGNFAIAGTTVNANDICLINSQAIQVSGYIVTATP